MNDAHLDRLISNHLSGTLTPEEHLEFEQRLLHSAADRERFWQEAETHAMLHAALQGGIGTASVAEPRVSRPRRWVPWRSVIAAAAGLVAGLFCASVAWAYAGPSFGRVITLLQEGFESSPPLSAKGVPLDADIWCGDYSEIVGGQQGVKPAGGERMLRFLRGDFEGRSIPSSHSSDVFRLVDVRPLRREFADGGAVVQLSAVFNATAFPEDEQFSATLTVFALDATLAGSEMVKAENVLSTESLAYSRSSKVAMDRDPASWQKVSNELRLPPGTDYLMLRMGMSNDTKSKDRRRDSFAGHFVDKVRLVLARRSEIPVP